MKKVQTKNRFETSLIGESGVAKDDPRIELNGEIDELAAVIGLALTACCVTDDTTAILGRVLESLGKMMAAVAGSGNIFGEQELESLAKDRAACESRLPPPGAFLTFLTSPLAAQLNHARTVCRRAERRCVSCGSDRYALAIDYLNRLSSLLFVLARMAIVESETK